MFVEDEVEAFDPLKTIYDFIQFVDRVCVVGLQVSETTPCDGDLRLLSNGTSVRQTHRVTCRTLGLHSLETFASSFASF